MFRYSFKVLVYSIFAGLFLCGPAYSLSPEAIAPHKALYKIKMIANHSSGRLVNVSGKMFYEIESTCDAWLTDHSFNLQYEYSDGSPVKVNSDFSTYETFDGSRFDFSSTRKQNGKIYQQLRGQAKIENTRRVAEFSKPEGLVFELQENTYFPIRHTLEMIRHMKNKDKFFNAVIFDGSDEDGPILINAFIGNPTVKRMKTDGQTIDPELLDGTAHNVRLAFFVIEDEKSESDYEMDMVFHENGVVSDMTIEYDNFTVRQTLMAIEKLQRPDC